MKYCSKCGQRLLDEAIVCTGCGCAQQDLSQKFSKDSSSLGWALLGFFFPLLGLILFLVWKDTYPLRANLLAKGALVAVITSTALSLICIIAIFAFAGLLI